MQNYSNIFGVQLVGDSLIIGSKRLAGSSMSKESALNLAAHLVHLADDSDGRVTNEYLEGVAEALPVDEDGSEGDEEEEAES